MRTYLRFTLDPPANRRLACAEPSLLPRSYLATERAFFLMQIKATIKILPCLEVAPHALGWGGGAHLKWH